MDFSPALQEAVDKVVAGLYLMKKGAAPEISYDLQGQLFKSKSGWIMLSVPNSLVRGAFDALNAPGAELPTGGDPDGRFNAHISVMRPEEVERVGGPDKITERGHQFKYRIRGFKTVNPSGWKEMSKVWMLEIHSPELEKLRKSYGLSAKPKDNKHEFHITVATRRKNVLRNSDIVKSSTCRGVVETANEDGAPYRERTDQWSEKFRQEARKRVLEHPLSMSKQSDALPGGKADDNPDKDFDKDQLEEGVKHELEHTDNKAVAKEVAKDHLEEDKDYYDKLDISEKMPLSLLEEMHRHMNNSSKPKGRMIVRQTQMTVVLGDKVPKIPKELEEIFGGS